MRSNTARSKTRTGKAAPMTASPVDDVLPGRLREWKDTVVHQTDMHPARTLAVAAGAGYLLGGGLFSPLTARLVATGVRLGLRFALLPFVSQSIIAMAEGLLTQGSTSGDDADHPFEVEGDNTNNATTTRQTDQKETHS